MHIGIDISQIVYEGTGVSRFTEGLIKAIIRHGKDEKWTFFFSSLRSRLNLPLQREIIKNNMSLKRIPLPPTILSVLWNDLHVIDIQTFTGKVDWFITSDWLEPPSSSKKTTIVHDLVYLRYPKTVTDSIKHVQSQRLKWIKQESRIVFCDSKSTKRDLVDLLNFSEDKLIVNYPGIEADNGSQTSTKSPDVRQKYSLKNPYVLSVGKLEPRKNIPLLITAFKELKLPNLELVIVGPKGWDSADYQNSQNIHFLGYVEEAELISLYKKALFFVFPSVWEGYGYPLVEAMRLGTPTAASNSSSLKELGENASYLFDPEQKESLKRTIKELYYNAELRNELSRKGKKRAEDFSWEAYYSKLVNSLKERS